MKAAVLTKYGEASSSFEIREVPKPVPLSGQVLIKVEAFGLNYADVMARRGLYKEAPPLPSILGYDVAGTVAEIGAGVSGFQVGDKVMAMTRFGGYAEYAITQALALAKIPSLLDAPTATALATQYCTAYFAAAEMVNLYEGDKVLVQSGAGGVGTALIQFAKFKGCEIFSTAGSSEKLDHLIKSGVRHAINYNTQDFEAEIKKITNGKGVDVIFDAVGGKSVHKGIRSLDAGGRLICYGASDLSGRNIFGKIKTGLEFGIYHPAFLMMPSKSIIGVNMLKIADKKPAVIQRCLKEVARLAEEGIFKPLLSKVFPVSEIGSAHDFLEKRKSMGKMAVKW